MKKLLLLIFLLFFVFIPNSNTEAYYTPEGNGPIMLNFIPEEIIPGQVVTINGYEFGDDSSKVEVYFGDEPATIIYWTDTEIKVKAPLSFTYNPGNIYVLGLFKRKSLYLGEYNYVHYIRTLSYYKVIPQIDDVVPDESQKYIKSAKIKGKYFGKEMKEVFFGDTKATVATWSPIAISVVISENASQPITVKVSDKLKATIEHHYLNPVPAENSNILTLVTPTEQPLSNDNADVVENDVSNDSTNDSDEVTVTEKSLVINKDLNLTRSLMGKILLQVEEHGEAWYVHPVQEKKFYMKDGDTAYQMLREFGLGITNADLEKIPVEGSNQTGDVNLVNRLKGYILLQVQEHGEAWYINPTDGKRYYLKNGAEAYRIMRELSLGITNSDLRKIEVGELSD